MHVAMVSEDRHAAVELDDLIDEDREHRIFRVNRKAFTSDGIFEREMERFRNEYWLYLGHESEVRNPGDFVVRNLVGRSLIFCRATNGELHVFLNSCPHRGTVVCRSPEGNAKFFTCFYHGFTYTNAGDLVAFSGDDDPRAYPPDFRERTSLRPVPRMANYRGFVFVSFNADVGSIEDHLADARDNLDLVADQGDDGVEVVKGTHLYVSRTNWKLTIENALDGPHFGPTHSTFIDWRNSTGYEVNGKGTWGELGNGHIYFQSSGFYGRSGLSWEPSWGEEERIRLEGVRKRLVERFGEERAHKIADVSRNSYIFPNLLVFDFIGISFRVLEPVSPGVTQLRAYEFGVVGEPPEARERRLNNLLMFVGPGGFATPDDLEAQQLAQSGYFATVDDPRAQIPWNDISRGFDQEIAGETTDIYNEANLRAFWRFWHGWVTGTGDAPVGRANGR
jgi:p-cumate 2,3-dioxygenase subunit alpha